MHKICFLQKILLGLFFLMSVICMANDLSNDREKLPKQEQNAKNQLLQKKRDFEVLLRTIFSRDPQKIATCNEFLDEYNQILYLLYDIRKTPEEWFRYYYYRFELYIASDVIKAEKYAETYCHYLESRPTHQWNDEILHILVLSDLSRVYAKLKNPVCMEKYFQKALQEYHVLLKKYKQKIHNSPALQYDVDELRESIYIVQNVNYKYLQKYQQAKQCLDEYLSYFKSEKEYSESVLNNGKLFEEQAGNCYKLDWIEGAEKYAGASIAAAEKRKIVNLISYLILAECYYKKRKFSEALITAEKGMRIPDGWISSGDFSNVMEAQLYLLASECCIQFKKIQKAQKYLDTAEKYSQRPEILSHIKRLKNEITFLRNNRDTQ